MRIFLISFEGHSNVGRDILDKIRHASHIVFLPHHAVANLAHEFFFVCGVVFPKNRARQLVRLVLEQLFQQKWVCFKPGKENADEPAFHVERGGDFMKCN